MLRKSVYPYLESFLNRAGEYLHKQGFSPNQLTLVGLALNFLAGCVFASGNIFFAGLVLAAASSADMLDGPLARMSKRVTLFGAFLDSTIDRYSDFFVFGGLAMYFARSHQGLWLLITLGILAGAFVTSYAKARAEFFIKECPVGIFERAERIIVLLAGSILGPLLPAALWVLLIGTNATAVQRILYTRKVLAAPPYSKSNESSS